MQKKIFLVCPSELYSKNTIFDLNSPFNRDNAWHPFSLLKKEFKKNGIELMTSDYIQETDTDYALIYIDFPHKNNRKFDKNIRHYLLILETELIIPENWDLKNHKYFDKIFTWNDDIVDNKKYFKFNFTQKILKNLNKDLSKKEKLCTLIAGNKKNNHPLELYSKRVEAIEWFEKNHLEDFDFYGIGWDKYTSSNKYINLFLSKSKLSKLFATSYLSYKGKVDSKIETLEKYKFSICYENVRNIPGYISEKIFDCFFAGCVPIYWGANNINQYIPRACFIDKRDFDSYENLYDFMVKMGNENYLEYLDNIEKYLNSEDIHPFSSEYFSETIVSNI